MENQSTRLFTRADVEQFVMGTIGKGENPRYAVDSVCLLKEMPVPTWTVRCTATWRSGNSYPSTSTVFQKDICGKPYLYFVIETEIPAGLANADDEDAAIAQREAERRAELLHKQGQSDASASSY